jgi:AraC-like DNA-binding protein
MSNRAALAEVPALLAGVSVEAGSTAQGDASRGELTLCFVHHGALSCFVGGRFLELPAGALCAYWSALPHHLVAAPSSESVFVHVPLPTVLRWSLNAGFVRKVLGGDALIDQQNPSWDAELSRRWLDDVRAGEPSALRTCELEVEARVRRLAWKRQHKTAARVPEHKARKQVEAITAFLAQGYRKDISTADIGRAIGLHPNYAMTLFRRECGMSIWQYLIRLRLAHAQLLLLTSEKTVLAIALDSGFGSLARFYAAFTRECGSSPGEYRKRGA